MTDLTALTAYLRTHSPGARALGGPDAGVSIGEHGGGRHRADDGAGGADDMRSVPPSAPQSTCALCGHAIARGAEAADAPHRHASCRRSEQRMNRDLAEAQAEDNDLLRVAW
jgi:hypothetical protein